MLILTEILTDSEAPPTVIKMEPQSQDQDLRAQYQGYQPTQYYRSDWPTTATPPTAQQPIEVIPQVPDPRRGLHQAAGESKCPA